MGRRRFFLLQCARMARRDAIIKEDAKSQVDCILNHAKAHTITLLYVCTGRVKKKKRASVHTSTPQSRSSRGPTWFTESFGDVIEGREYHSWLAPGAARDFRGSVTVPKEKTHSGFLSCENTCSVVSPLCTAAHVLLLGNMSFKLQSYHTS